MRMPLALALAAAIAGPAAAQDPEPPANDGDIVVERKLDRDKEISDFVDALTKTPFRQAIGRFEAAVCPGVVGLTPQQNQQVADRLRKVAAEVGIAVGGENCGPNALVVVAGDKEAFVKALRAKYPAYFKDPLGDGIRLPEGDESTIAWHVEGMLDANGEKAGIVQNNDGSRYYSVEAPNGWRMKPGMRPHFAAGILVVERAAAAGLTTTQLADYAAMRIYGKTKPERLAKSSAPTILTIIDAPDDAYVPVTMTSWDLAFLKSLYAVDPMQYSSRQRARIKNDVREALDRKD